ncbi:hypothetical protein SGR_3984 [Streptomyces griseus subsp. griseus NBRC 13350]|uniref:Uncharacterized protein n=1 Tax=Streptomyces griseus subsp. griseus (strain JCM 4626 / CBS 651.72 / NBRC 13350 / KCC S-0626 / ISP 5235) TaxID=455632 RepID=B1VS59_STRGG|nr:hypothetical protein SGR_3984 [Streptomyces griseus subsp. griseus NBRC 13350]
MRVDPRAHRCRPSRNPRTRPAGRPTCSTRFEGDMMCRSCATTASPAHPSARATAEAPGRTRVADHGLSRRRLLAGLGLGALAVNVPAGASPAAAAAGEAAAAKNGAWANPALGRFPAGGHYGAPRGGASHAGQDVSNSTGTAVHAAAGGTVVRRSWGGGLPGAGPATPW